MNAPIDRSFEGWLLDYAHSSAPARAGRIEAARALLRTWAQLHLPPFQPDTLHALVAQLADRKVKSDLAWCFIQLWGEYERWRALDLLHRSRTDPRLGRAAGRAAP